MISICVIKLISFNAVTGASVLHASNLQLNNFGLSFIIF